MKTRETIRGQVEKEEKQNGGQDILRELNKQFDDEKRLNKVSY